MIIGVPDSKLKPWLRGKEYVIAADEGEAVGIATGYYLATGKRATVFMSADGFCNALNPITSLVLPYEIPMNFIISTGRTEPQHKEMSDKLERLINLIYDTGECNIELIR